MFARSVLRACKRPICRSNYLSATPYRSYSQKNDWNQDKSRKEDNYLQAGITGKLIVVVAVSGYLFYWLQKRDGMSFIDIDNLILRA